MNRIVRRKDYGLELIPATPAQKRNGHGPYILYQYFGNKRYCRNDTVTIERILGIASEIGVLKSHHNIKMSKDVLLGKWRPSKKRRARANK